MRDLDIRAALHARLEAQHQGDRTTRVIDELGVLTGNCRIDVAVINGRLEGFEIKSERDTLRRLPHQSKAYGRVFDRVTVVCSDRHLSSVLTCIPQWWGIAAASVVGDQVRIVGKRAARANPAVEPEAVVQLLWREEALAALEELGLAGGLRSKPRRVLWSALAEALPPRKLRALVRDQLRARENWRAGE